MCDDEKREEAESAVLEFYRVQDNLSAEEFRLKTLRAKIREAEEKLSDLTGKGKKLEKEVRDLLLEEMRLKEIGAASYMWVHEGGPGPVTLTRPQIDVVIPQRRLVFVNWDPMDQYLKGASVFADGSFRRDLADRVRENFLRYYDDFVSRYLSFKPFEKKYTGLF